MEKFWRKEAEKYSSSDLEVGTPIDTPSMTPQYNYNCPSSSPAFGTPATPSTPYIYERLTLSTPVCTQSPNQSIIERLYTLKGILDGITDDNNSISYEHFHRVFQQDPTLCQAIQQDYGRTINRDSFLLDTCRASALDSHEQMKFVFDLFDTTGREAVTRSQVTSFLLATYQETKVNNTTFEEIVDMIFTRYGTDTLNLDQFEQVFIDVVTKAGDASVKPPKAPRKTCCKSLRKYYRHHRNKIGCLTLYFCLNVLIFSTTFLNYPYDAKTKYGQAFAKGFAKLTLLNTLLAILPVCRGIVSFMRQQQTLWRYVPFDQNIEFHKLSGLMVILSAALHSLSWIYIIHHVDETHRLAFLQHQSIRQMCLHWPIWTGLGMCTCLLLAWPFTFERIRRGSFNLFWYSHILLFPFLFLLIFHGVSAWTDSPEACFWILPPCLLYFMERRHRFGKRGRTELVKVELEKDMVALYMRKPLHFDQFQPGMYLFLNVPMLSKFEWHPFTISSAPEDELLSVHIQCNGDWTNALHAIISAFEKRKSNELEILIDGPIGAPSQDYTNHSVVMLIGAGIGITPFASILKSTLKQWKENQCPECGKIQSELMKIYFYWVTRDQESLQWFSTTMNQLSRMDIDQRLEMHTYYSAMKRQSLIAPLQLLQTFVHQEQGHDIISGLETRQLTHFGRPNWTTICESVAATHPNEEIGVFLCGPEKLDKSVSNVCAEYNLTKRHNVQFHYQSENF